MSGNGSSKLYIGLGHKARHGKNFVADVIHAVHPTTTRVLGFADALKAHCRVAYGMRAKDAPLLQMVGTDLYRRQNPNIWVEVLEATANDYPEPIILIPDCRFPNEVEFVTSRGGFTIKVTRYTPDGRVYVAPDRDPAHASETALDDYVWNYSLGAASGDVQTLRRDALTVFTLIEREVAARKIAIPRS